VHRNTNGHTAAEKQRNVERTKTEAYTQLLGLRGLEGADDAGEEGVAAGGREAVRELLPCLTVHPCLRRNRNEGKRKREAAVEGVVYLQEG
jgi:hypothetical protein